MLTDSESSPTKSASSKNILRFAKNSDQHLHYLLFTQLIKFIVYLSKKTAIINSDTVPFNNCFNRRIEKIWTDQSLEILSSLENKDVKFRQRRRAQRPVVERFFNPSLLALIAGQRSKRASSNIIRRI